MSDNEKTNRPSWSAPLLAAGRQGLDEIAQILPPFPDSIRCVNEPGTLGNPTMQMITEQMRGDESYEQMLDQYAGKEQEPPQREQEMER
jgi:hypothetical protein